MKNTAEELAGNIKEAAGRATSDKNLSAVSVAAKPASGSGGLPGG